MTNNLTLPFDDDVQRVEERESRLEAIDAAGRARAVDPRFNVALEASAGTGKTRVLVDRYINLLRAGVDPSNILAITFTRKAAAEMRERILTTLREAAERGEITPARWRDLRDRTADIGISTIDAFCLSLLREFPLEADLDPGFAMADETEVPRLIDEALDGTLRIGRSLARQDDELALAFSQLGERRLRAALAVLLNRRIVAPAILERFLSGSPREIDIEMAVNRAATALHDLFESAPGGLEALIECGPPHPAFLLLARALRALDAHVGGRQLLDAGQLQAVFTRIRDHFLTRQGDPRRTAPFARASYPRGRERDWRQQRDLVLQHGSGVVEILTAYRRDLNVIVARGLRRLYAVATAEYRRTLERHAVLDFSELLLRALDLLRQMEEFSRSRYRLESRYHHVLVDEFQDTSRAQWELVSLLVQAWGAGAGLAHEGPLPPSIFIVGDRKQSIYGFRDADVGVLREAAQAIERLRPDGNVRQSIARSFRSVPALLAFVNDVCADIDKAPDRRDAFEYGERDRFPVPKAFESDPAIGLIGGTSPEACADAVSDEIARLLAAGVTVRDRDSGVRRAVRAGDIAILFRTRDSHREFEAALERRGVPSYVYKGLGFFDADETKDVLALLWYLADPLSDLRTAAFLRSRFVRLSDAGLQTLAPRLADALRSRAAPEAFGRLDAEDRAALEQARADTLRWRGLVDRLPPAELLDVVLNESAYDVELRGPRFAQARENLKKMRALVRRLQNRGYATMASITAHLDRLAVGDDSNAVIDAHDAVQLMTVHASKGLEFPIVFLVNLARGTGNRRDPVRLAPEADGVAAAVAVGDFQSDADADSGAREREESKRLLYVALTRARDRLYLSTVLKDGAVQPGRGSLAEVMPRSLLDLFSAAQAREGDLEWRASSGAVHRLCTCSPVTPAAVPTPPAEASVHAAHVPDSDFTPLGEGARVRVAIAAPPESAAPPVIDAAVASDRLLGTLVHRLLQRFGLTADLDLPLIRATALRMLQPDEAAVLLGEPDQGREWLARARTAYRAIVADARVRELLQRGEPMHETPFTMRTEGGAVRGTIDCLVREEGRVTVLEFKTGRPRDEHQAQLALYQRAVERMFPGILVQGHVIYAGAEVRQGSD